MATKTTTGRNTISNRSATIQWVAIAVIAGLGVIAAFTIFGSDSGGGGGHSGLPAVSAATN